MFSFTGVIRDDSSMFTTKSIVELRDCYNNVVFSSNVGKSKEKEYKKAYHEAIRNAFKSVQTLKYKYTPSKQDIVASKEMDVPVLVPTPKTISKKPIKTKEIKKKCF